MIDLFEAWAKIQRDAADPRPEACIQYERYAFMCMDPRQIWGGPPDLNGPAYDELKCYHGPCPWPLPRQRHFDIFTEALT